MTTPHPPDDTHCPHCVEEGYAKALADVQLLAKKPKRRARSVVMCPHGFANKLHCYYCNRSG